MKKLKSKKTLETVKRLNEIRAQIKALNEEKKRIDFELFQLRDTKKINSFEIENFKVIFNTILRKNFDRKAFEKINGPDSLTDFLKPTISNTIILKEKTC